MAEVGTITVRLVSADDHKREAEWRRELERVNADLSKAHDELAELHARDSNAYAREVVERELRASEGRMLRAERLATEASRRALSAEAKLARIKRVIQGKA